MTVESAEDPASTLAERARDLTWYHTLELAPGLTTDGMYDVLLVRTYLETLIDEFGGSYALAIAAYNAGPGRVRQWLHDYGDPRGCNVDMVDWIENIPIDETRNYVQAILESLGKKAETPRAPAAPPF